MDQVRPCPPKWLQPRIVDWSAYPADPIRWQPRAFLPCADPVQKRVPGDRTELKRRVDSSWPVTEGWATARFAPCPRVRRTDVPLSACQHRRWNVLLYDHHR